MALPSWTHLGLGLGVTALALFAATKAIGSSSGVGSSRYVNVDGTTLRMKKLGNGRFEVACWGPGIIFTEEPGQPLATYVFGQDGPLSAQGNPIAINFIEGAMNKVPGGLFSDEFKRCERPGCFVGPSGVA